MAVIKWDEKYFEQSGLFIWIYRNGMLESSNEKFYRPSLRKMYSGGKTAEKKANNLNIERGTK